MATYLIKSPASLNSGGWAYMRSLARDSNGRLWCCYWRVEAGAFAIFAAYSDDNGVTWNEEAVSAKPGSSQHDPSLAVDSNDDVHVVWYGLGYGTYPARQQIVYRRRISGVWQAVEQITDVDETQYGGAIAVDSNDDIHIAWNGGGYGALTTYLNTCYCKRTAGGWGAITKLYDVNRNQYAPSIAIGTDDSVHVMWPGEQAVNQHYIWYRQYTAGAWQAVEQAIPMNALPTLHGCLALDSGNYPHYTWRAWGYGVNLYKYNIQYVYKTAGGWQSVESLTDKDADQDSPSISIDMLDNVHVVWPGRGWGANPTKSNLQYNTKVVGGAWGAQVGLIDDPGGSGPAASFIWATFPSPGNIPIEGYAFPYELGVDVWIWLSVDLSWLGRPIAVSKAYALSRGEL